MLSSSVASGRSFLKVLGVEEEPHLVTVLMEKMSAVKELQTLSEDMSDWLSGSKQGIAALVCVLVMCLYYWSLGVTDTQFTEKQAYYERIGWSQSIILVDIVVILQRESSLCQILRD